MYVHPNKRLRIDYTTNQWVPYGLDESNINTNTFYRLEILQSLIVDKVRFKIFMENITGLFYFSMCLKSEWMENFMFLK